MMGVEAERGGGVLSWRLGFGGGLMGHLLRVA
jgi:hypothetical protein